MNNDHFAAFACGFVTAWIVCDIEIVNMTPRRRRGSNPPPPATKPQPPSGPPQPLAAQLIRYWTWEDDQTRQAFTEGRTIRGNGNGGPTTSKPEFPPGRVTDVHGRTIGYRSINYPDPSPGRRPTNPFNGERIPNPPPREP